MTNPAGGLLEWILRLSMFRVSASWHFVLLCTFSLDLDMGPAGGGARHQVSDLYGRENPGGWPWLLFSAGSGLSYWHTPFWCDLYFLFLYSIVFFLRSCVNMGDLGSWGEFRYRALCWEVATWGMSVNDEASGVRQKKKYFLEEEKKLHSLHYLYVYANNPHINARWA